MNESDASTGEFLSQGGFPKGGDWWEEMQRWTPTRRVEFLKSCLSKQSIVGFSFGAHQEVSAALSELGLKSGPVDWRGDLALVLGHEKTRYCLRTTQHSGGESGDAFNLLVDFAGNGQVTRAATNVTNGLNADTPLCGWTEAGSEGWLDVVEGTMRKVRDYDGIAKWPDVEMLIASVLSGIETALATGLGRRSP